MPIYEYYCYECANEFQLLRTFAQADEAAPCPTCGKGSERQLSTFSFKSNSFTAPRLKHTNTKPLRSYNRQPGNQQQTSPVQHEG